MDFSQLSQTLVDSASIIITALVGMGVVYLRSYVGKRIENEEIKSSILLSMTTLENSVKGSIQELSVNAKTALADGKLTKAEIKSIQDKAIDHFNKQVSPALQKRLEAHVGDVEQWLLNKINAELQKADKVTG
jgi:tetrahydromethanopterin S-methyltransferase subunit H